MCPFKEVIKPCGYDHFHPVVSFENQASGDGFLLPRNAALFPEPSALPLHWDSLVSDRDLVLQCT